MEKLDSSNSNFSLHRYSFSRLAINDSWVSRTESSDSSSGMVYRRHLHIDGYPYLVLGNSSALHSLHTTSSSKTYHQVCGIILTLIVIYVFDGFKKNVRSATDRWVVLHWLKKRCIWCIGRVSLCFALTMYTGDPYLKFILIREGHDYCRFEIKAHSLCTITWEWNSHS